MKTRADPLIRPTDPLMSAFHTSMEMMQEILLQQFWYDQSHHSHTIVYSGRARAEKQQSTFVHVIVRCYTRRDLRLRRTQLGWISGQVHFQITDPHFLFLCLLDPLDPDPLDHFFLQQFRLSTSSYGGSGNRGHLDHFFFIPRS